MARQRQAQQEPQAGDKVTLVSPDGEITREVVVGSKEDTGLRWDGFLPKEQAELEAPENRVQAPVGPPADSENV
jgi:hypothetical protein